VRKAKREDRFGKRGDGMPIANCQLPIGYIYVVVGVLVHCKKGVFGLFGLGWGPVQSAGSGIKME